MREHVRGMKLVKKSYSTKWVIAYGFLSGMGSLERIVAGTWAAVAHGFTGSSRQARAKLKLG